jgi:polyhydroxyalkanoate synthesis regulator phasin
MAEGKDKSRSTPADAVRSAVDQAVQATFHATEKQAQFTRERAQELVDELAGTATRIREALEDLRPPTGDDVRTLRARVEELEARVAALEAAAERE